MQIHLAKRIKKLFPTIKKEIIYDEMVQLKRNN